MKLFVFWGPNDHREAHMQVPMHVRWEDGTPATLPDFAQHQYATQVAIGGDKGMVTVLMPGIIASTYFDVANGRWILKAPGHRPIDLLITDPSATDEEIRADISTCPVIYETTIDRTHVPDKTLLST
jgi:hypothetical protein